jgi:uncharacterized protein DUF3570
MQLRRHERIRTAVTAATAALLGSGTNARAADSGKLESTMLIYSETDRVKAVEGVVDFTKQVNDRRSFGVRLTLDGLTGASPNGATPASHVQTFTGPSGSLGYTAPAGQIPLDSSFSDARFAVDGSMTQLLDRLTSFTFGGHLSIERDYNSIGANVGIRRDFFHRNTTLGISGAYSHDTVSPMTGAPVPFSPLPPPSAGGGEGEGEGEAEGSGPGKGKDVADAVFGLTQILDRRTLLRLDYSLSRASGYLTDPYKLLSVVQDWGSAAPGDPAGYLYENRPAQHNKQAVFTDVRRYVAGATVDLSYRYFWDDWGIVSHSVDSFVRIPLGRGHAIEPHYRWYRQSAADFYHWYLVEGQPLPAFASADSRLAAFDAATLGLKYSFPLKNFDQLSISAEYYKQMGSRGPPDAIGVLGQYDLFPRLNVFMVRMGYTRDF